MVGVTNASNLHFDLEHENNFCSLEKAEKLQFPLFVSVGLPGHRQQDKISRRGFMRERPGKTARKRSGRKTFRSQHPMHITQSRTTYFLSSLRSGYAVFCCDVSDMKCVGEG